MKILTTSDWHPDWVTAGVDRYSDVEHAVEEMLEVCVDGEVDAFLFIGDLCDPGTHRSHRAVALAVRVAEELRSEGVEQLWLPGNHDVIEDGNGLSTLCPLAELGYLNLMSAPGVTQLSRPRRVPGGRAEMLNVLCLPFTPRSHDYDPEEKLRELAKHGVAPDIIAGHLNIEGITPGSETVDMPRGRNVFYPYDVARELFPGALLLNGHYHQQQVWKGTNGRNKQGIHIPGSPTRLMRVERDHTPGWLIIETGGN